MSKKGVSCACDGYMYGMDEYGKGKKWDGWIFVFGGVRHISFLVVVYVFGRVLEGRDLQWGGGGGLILAGVPCTV